MKSLWKALMGLMISLPMLSYVTGSLIAAQQDPPQYEVVVLRPADGSLSTLTALDPRVPDELPDLTPTKVEAITPSPDDLKDDSDDSGRDGWNDSDDSDNAAGSPGDETRSDDDDADDDDNSGSGSGSDDDDNSGSGSDDDGNSGSGKDDDADDDGDDDSEPDSD